MAGRRPDKKVVLKSKDKNTEGKHTYVDLVATWINEDWTQRLSLDRNIAAIELADGRRVTPDQYYVNVQEQRSEAPARPATRQTPAFNSFED